MKNAKQISCRREPQFPTRWIKTKSESGLHYLRIVGGSKRDRNGRKVYRLRHLSYDVISRKEWTRGEIMELSPAFLKRRPAARNIARTR